MTPCESDIDNMYGFLGVSSSTSLVLVTSGATFDSVCGEGVGKAF